MAHPRTPCRYCGGPKPAGRGRKACDKCLDEKQPIFEQQRYKDRLERARENRLANGKHRKLQSLAPAGEQWCPRCSQYLPDSEFGPRGAKRAVYCRPCGSAYHFEKRLAKTFGITVEEYERLLLLQDSRCAICERKPRQRRLAVDHDHLTGEVRGLLCTRCNHKILGSANESGAVLRRAARYLDAPPAQTGQAVPADESDLLELRLADAIDRAEEARVDNHADYSAVWHHRRGKATPADGFVTMTGATFVRLLRDAGFGNPLSASQGHERGSPRGTGAPSPHGGPQETGGAE